MAAPRLITVRDFTTSRFAQLADTSTANFTEILARAEAAVQRQLRRPILPTAYAEVHRPHGSTIYLRQRPVLSIESVGRSMFAGSAISPFVNFAVDYTTGILTVAGAAGAYYYTVEYIAGFETVPEDIKEAILMQAALFAYQDLEIYGSGDSKPPGILYMKDDIKDLLEPYKQLHIAY